MDQATVANEIRVPTELRQHDIARGEFLKYVHVGLFVHRVLFTMQAKFSAGLLLGMNLELVR